MIVDQVRDLVECKYPDDWNDRCPEVACHAVYVLRQYDLIGHRIAAGRVEEHGTHGLVAVLFRGEYTGTGASQYDTWVVGPSGEVLDFSVVPKHFGMDDVWYPYEPALVLKYTKIVDTTDAVSRHLQKRYGGICT